MSEKQSVNGGEVIVEVQSDEINEAKGSSSKASESLAPKQSKEDLRESTESSSTGLSKPIPVGFPSPDISRASPNPGNPPRIPTRNESLNRRQSFNRSVTKPKSRFGELPSPVMNEDGSSVDQIGANYRSFSRGSPNIISGRTKDTEDEEIYKVKMSRDKHGKVNKIILIEWIVFLCILGCLVASLTIQKLESYKLWSLKIWKWCVLVMVIFRGMVATNWVINFIVFVIKHNYLLRTQVLYFIHGMKKSVQVFMWLLLVLLTWLLLVNRGRERSKLSTKILDYVMWTIVSVLIGSFLWLSKTLLSMLLASRFQLNTFYDRIQESIFHQYVLQTLSGPPLFEEADKKEKEAKSGKEKEAKSGKENEAKSGKENEVIDMTKLHKIEQEKVSSWTINKLVDAITSSGLSTIFHTLDEMEGLNEQRDKEINSEMEATAAAYNIFLNVAQIGARYIEEQDLLRFMIEEDVDIVWPLIDVANTGQVDRKTLTEWVVKIYNDHKGLAHSLTDTKKCVNQLNKIVTCIVIVITIVVWLLLVGIVNITVLILLSSQLVLAAFMFGNTCKNIFEAIVFVFVTHPFDAGDRCVVDGVPLLVEEMNLLTTVFLKLNDEMVYYPNSILSTKIITNYNRSPHMGDTVEFTIDMIPVEKIGLLKIKIKEYFESARQYWHEKHSLVVTEMENTSKLKMVLYFKHTMNFQEFGEKNARRAELIIALLKILEEQKIIYYLLPHEVHLAQTKTDATVA